MYTDIESFIKAINDKEINADDLSVDIMGDMVYVFNKNNEDVFVQQSNEVLIEMFPLLLNIRTGIK